MNAITPFQVDVIAAPEATHLRCTGELDIATTPVFEACLDTLLSERRFRVELDLSAVRCLDSSGVSALVAAHERFRARRGTLYIGRSNPRIDRLLDLLALRHLQRIPA